MKIIILLILVSFGLFNTAYPNCPFCSAAIIEEQSVFETDSFYVFCDYKPRVKGHLLIVPKRHVFMAHQLHEQEWKELYSIMPRVVKVFEDYLGTNQYIILEKNGPMAFQEIPHVHFHLLPVQTQQWAEIFDIIPSKIIGKELQDEVAILRHYFTHPNT